MNPQKFHSWAEVMASARKGEPLIYQAPMDPTPVRFVKGTGSWTYAVKGNAIRLTPPKSAADPFVADVGHLDRFRMTFTEAIRATLIHEGGHRVRHPVPGKPWPAAGDVAINPHVQTRPFPGESPAAWNERHALAVEEAERNTPAGEARRQRENAARLEAARRALAGVTGRVVWEPSGGGTGWRGRGASGRVYLLRRAGGDSWNLHVDGREYRYESLARAKQEAEELES